MDPTSIIGVVLGVGIMVHSVGFESGLRLFFNPHAILIVFGGTFAASLVHFPLTQLIKFIPRLKAIFSIKRKDYYKDVSQITSLADKIKREGRLAITPDVETIKDHFLRDSLQLFIDKVPPDQLESIMRENINAVAERHEQGIVFFEQLAKYAPGFGLVGTLTGLVTMLAHLHDPHSLGPNMSIALVATFYGVLLSNLVFLPLAGRLKISSYEEILQKEMQMKGIVSMALGDSSYIIREKMAMFVSEGDRKRLQRKLTQKR